MRMNFIREKCTSGSVTRGMFMAGGAVFSVEIAAECGFDWLLLDMEHGLGSEQNTLAQITALKHTKCAPIVRIPALSAKTIKRILDFGASGIMCPMIENAEQAEQLVRAMRYPPEGIRGLSSGSRAASYGFSFTEYFEKANRELLCIAQIESRAGVEHAGEIAAVDGIDILFIGHSDLSLNLGSYNEFDSEVMCSAEDAVLGAAAEHGKSAGMLIKQNMRVEPCLEKGFRFLALGTDLGCIRSMFHKLLKQSLQPE